MSHKDHKHSPKFNDQYVWIYHTTVSQSAALDILQTIETNCRHAPKIIFLPWLFYITFEDSRFLPLFHEEVMFVDMEVYADKDYVL